MDLPDFDVMTADERKAWRQRHEATNARINQLVVERVNCPYCQAFAGHRCKPPRWADPSKKVGVHKARRDAWIDSGRPGWDE